MAPEHGIEAERALARVREQTRPPTRIGPQRPPSMRVINVAWPPNRRILVVGLHARERDRMVHVCQSRPRRNERAAHSTGVLGWLLCLRRHKPESEDKDRREDAM